MKRNVMLLLMLGGLILWSAPVSAEFISQWGYVTDGIFTEWDNENGGDSNIDPFNAKTLSGVSGYQGLAWGTSTGSGRSRLTLGEVGGTLATNGPSDDAMTITHYNRPVYGPSLQSGTVFAVLTLTPLVPSLPSLPTFSTQLDFDFFESPNSGLSQGDLFILANPLAATETFTLDDYAYTVSFTGFSQITDTSYLALLAQNGFIEPGEDVWGWYTMEGATNVLPTYVQISGEPVSNPVPEPATMLLLGSGFLGMGLAACRRLKK